MQNTDDSRRLAALFMDTIPQVMRIVAADMRQHAPPGTDPAYFRLLHVLRRHGACRLGDLADKLVVSMPTMSNTISTLEERGWVVRERDVGDRRVVQVTITQEGEAILQRLHLEMIGKLAAALSDLSQSERDQLASGLNILKHLFDTPPATDEDRST